jgi:membrane-associated protease RseP (regulator of RpoE activity)
VCRPMAPVPSPATEADIRVDDVVVALDGNPVSTWDEFTDGLAQRQPGDAVLLGIDRAGSRVETRLVLAEAVYPVLDDSGEPTGQTQSLAFVGIRPDASYVPMSIAAVPGYMWDLTVRSVEALVSLPARIVELTGTLITGGDRDPDGPVSVVGISRIGGEIAALDEPIKAKAAAFLGLAAALNLFLFLFNLVPLLPLDGGHVAAAAYESVRRTAARLRGAADPGPVDTARMLPVTYAVAAVLLTAGVIVIFADLVKPITLTG